MDEEDAMRYRLTYERPRRAFPSDHVDWICSTQELEASSDEEAIVQARENLYLLGFWFIDRHWEVRNLRIERLVPVLLPTLGTEAV